MTKVLSKQEISNFIVESLSLKSEQKSIDRAIMAYGRRVGPWDSLCGIVSRMINAVKAVFGKSDWQKATVVFSKWFRTVALKENGLAEHDELRFSKEGRKYLERLTYALADSFLAILVGSTYTSEVDKYLDSQADSFFKSVDVAKLTELLKKEIRENASEFGDSSDSSAAG